MLGRGFDVYLYTGSSAKFIGDVVQNRIADSMKTSFFNHFRFNPSPNEVRSWQNSLRAVSNVLQYGSFDDHGILFRIYAENFASLAPLLAGNHHDTVVFANLHEHVLPNRLEHLRRE